jgi:hypothetical protein
MAFILSIKYYFKNFYCILTNIVSSVEFTESGFVTGTGTSICGNRFEIRLLKLAVPVPVPAIRNTAFKIGGTSTRRFLNLLI